MQNICSVIGWNNVHISNWIGWNQHLIVLNLYSVSINEVLVTEFKFKSIKESKFGVNL